MLMRVLMFRSRRSRLIRRLERFRRKDQGNGDLAWLVQLQDNQLEMLLAAVESRGHATTSCVLLPRKEKPSDEDEPHVVSCRLWRWSSLQSAHELRRMPSCRSASDPVYTCCNPYHWSRLCSATTESPPPYSLCAIDGLRPEDRAPSEAPLVFRETFPSGSLTTSGEDSNRNSLAWCTLAYWEMSQRVGSLYHVEPSAVNIFGKVPYGDGLSLDTLAQYTHAPDSVSRTRCKIGLGVTLSNEDGAIWVYNRSDVQIFVNSTSLEARAPPWGPTGPVRVSPESCLCVHDPHTPFPTSRELSPGPRGPLNIRISFAKGWGPRYSRQDITSCPCWLEVLLAPCR